MPDPTAPDPFAILAQPPQMDPQTMALMQQTVGQPSLAPQPVQGVSRLPGVAGMISNLVHPPTQVQVNPKTKMAEARPASRLDVFENFLGNFLNSLSQGMAGSGTGPGANIRGAGIAMQAPRQLAIQNQQLANQQQLTQAQAQEAQQRGQYYASQSGELAPMSPETAAAMGHPEWAGIPMKQVLSNLAKPQVTNQGKVDVANIGAKAKTDVANISANARIIAANGLQNENKWIKAVNDPNTPPADKLLAEKNLALLQKRRTDLAVTRGAAFASAKAENTPFPVFDADGNVTTVSAKDAIRGGYPSATVWNTIYGPTGSTKTQGQAAGAVKEHIDDYEKSIRNLAAKGQLGAVMGRLNTYMNDGYGGDDPDIANFVTTTSLIKSGAVRAHFGGRGGAQILDKFDKVLNTSQEPNAIIGSVEGIKSFLKTYKETGTPNPPSASRLPSKGGSKVDSLVNKYGGS